MPLLPQGATLHSLATFLHRSCGSRSISQGYLRYYGIPKHRLEPGNPIGRGARYLAENFLGGRVLGTELIRCHTLLGIYGPAMHPSWWGNMYAAKFADGSPLWKFRVCPWLPRPLAWCPTCCRNDFSRYGWAPWRVVHQVPFVHHCVDHGTALLTLCASCREPLDRGYRWRLPGDACRKCNGRKFRADIVVMQSPGYHRLINVLAALNRVMIAGEPLPWDRNFPWGGSEVSILERVKTVPNLLSDLWKVSDPQASIPRRLGVDKSINYMASISYPMCDHLLATLLVISLLPEFA